MTKRRIFKLSGADVTDFLQGLVTNDVTETSNGLVYSALLTPQGKLIADFFLLRIEDAVLLDVAASHADLLAARLNMYKLRASVTIEDSTLHMHRGLGDIPSDAYADPRNADLGWRAYRDHAQTNDSVDWTALRVALEIPETGVELTSDCFILEMGFERLSGVDFRKGCYVGQEVTARMKHKTELRKGLSRVTLDGAASTGSEITSDGRPAGTLHCVSGNEGLAYLRFDRAKGDMQAGNVVVKRLK